MNILFTRFPLESHFGGAEVQTLNLMKGLREGGHEVSFLGSCPVLFEESTKSQIPSTKLEIGDPPVTKWGAIRFLWKQRGMRKKLIEMITRCHAEHGRSMTQGASPFDWAQGDTAIFMLSLSEKLLLTEWAVAQGIKVFWLEHDRIGRWLTANPWLPKLRKLSRLVTTVVVSDLSRDLYLKLGWDPKKTTAIPNGIDTTRFTPRPSPSPNPSPFRVGCIARLTEDKGIDLLIEAVRDLPNVTLTIVGKGKEENAIRKRMDDVNQQTSKPANQQTSPRVRLLSSIDPVQFYKKIDCLVLPSREHDPFGLVIAEAMAAGVPTILTDACGIARHLHPEDALIVPAGDAQVLRRALEEVQRKECWERLAERGPRIAQEKFSLERMVHAYADLL